MKEQLTALYALQEIDIKIARVNALLATLTGAKEQRKKYAVAKAALEAAEKTLTGYEVELKDSELKLKSIDEKRSGYEKRLYGGNISNPKELAAVEKEIAALKAQQGELDPRVLELYDLVEQSKGKADSAKQALEEAEKIARAAIKKEAAEKAHLEAELTRFNEERAEAAAKVTDRALLSRYDSVRQKTGAGGIAKVVDGRCEGCHVAITAYIMRSLYTTDETQKCENCGRILLLEV